MVSVLLLVSCTPKEKMYAPAVEWARPGKPVIKTRLTKAQQKQFKKTGEHISGLFLLKDGKPVKDRVICTSNLEGDTLIVTPQFVLGNGLEFEYQVYDGGDTLRKRFGVTIPDALTELPVVEHIYPLSDKVPSNILLFHVLFSGAMQEDETAFTQIKILDDKGNEKRKVWREKAGWTREGKHLVLMIHPGRVKRGIDYLKEMGVLFEEGKTYTMVVSASLKDAHGRPMEKEFKKTFTVTAPDRVMPEVHTVQVLHAKKDSRETLTVHFNEAMDFGAMLIGMEVLDKDNKKVKGEISCTDDKSWSFVPEETWKPGSYILQLNTHAADLASNHLVRHFEEKDIEEMTRRESVRIPVKVE